MSFKKLFILSFVTGTIVFSIFAILFALAHPEYFDFIKEILGI